VLASFAFRARCSRGILSVLLAIAPMFVFGIGAVWPHGGAHPGISVNPEVIGSASGLYGFSQGRGRDLHRAGGHWQRSRATAATSW